jgi:hypothetical protein
MRGLGPRITLSKTYAGNLALKTPALQLAAAAFGFILKS